MQIVFGAQPNGFGPVSKLVAIAGLIADEKKVFVGDGTALEFARRNSYRFSQIIPCALQSLHKLKPLLLESDFGVVLMYNEMAFWLAVLGRPFYFFDSLFGFWIVNADIPSVIEAARRFRTLGPEPAHELFHSFSTHEQKIMCHILARRSFVQNFVGVRERVEMLAREGISNIQVIGSIVDVTLESAEPLQTSESLAQSEDSGGRWEMLINLCGVKNFILDYFQNDYYIDIFERWARDFLCARPECREILICCGRYAEPQVEHIGSGLLRRQFLPHEEFIQAVDRAKVFLSAPGLTSINEAVHLRRLPVLLPEQHYSQFYNLGSLRGTQMGKCGVSYRDVFEDYSIPVHDYRGSSAIIEYTKQLHDSESLYEKFTVLLGQRVDQMLSLSFEAREQALNEVQGMLDGDDLRSVVQEVLKDFQQYRSTAKS